MNVNPGEENLTTEDRIEQLKAMVRPMRATPKAQAATELDTVSVVMSFYYQPYEEPATGYEVRVSRKVTVSGKQEHRIPRLNLTEESIPLPLGEYSKGGAGIIFIENKTGSRRRTNPTVEEQEADEEAIIILEDTDTGKPIAYIPNGMPFFGVLASPESVSIRVHRGTGLARVVVIPE